MKIFFLGVPLLGVSACGTQEDTDPTDPPECGNGLDSGSLNVHTGGDTAEGGETGEIHDTHQGSDTGTSVGHGDTGEMNQYFEVDQFGVFFDGAVLDGEVSSWSSSGISKQGNFVVFAADSDWDGTLEDEDHSCQIWFEFGSLTVTHEPSFVAAGAWEGWTLDTSPAAFLGQMGTCENFDPTIWDLGLYDYVSQNTWGLGVGPLPSELQDVLVGRDDGTDTDGDGVTDLQEEIANMVGGYVYATTSGSGTVYPYNYGYVYDLQDDGEMKLGADGKPTMNTSAAGSRDLVDGYYDMQPGTPLPY